MLANSSPLTTILRQMEPALLINAKLLQILSHFISPPFHGSMGRFLLAQPPKEELLQQMGVIHPSHVAHPTQSLCRHNILQRLFYSKFPSHLYAGKIHHVLLDAGDSENASETFVVEGLQLLSGNSIINPRLCPIERYSEHHRMVHHPFCGQG